MPTFQDARDGLDALLKDAKGNLTLSEKEEHLKMAARTFQGRVPRILSVEVDGDGGFEYALPTGYVDGFSSLLDVYYPWDSTEQNPTPLEVQQYRIWDGPNGKKFRFLENKPLTGEQFLVQFTAPHLVGSPEDTSADLLDASTVLPVGETLGDSVNVDEASDAQIYVTVGAVAGTSLDIFVQASHDDSTWQDIGALNTITEADEYVFPMEAFRVSTYVRLRCVATGGTFTVTAAKVAWETNTFTIPDHSLEAFLYLAASISAQALSDFYAHLMDSQLDGDSTDYEGKSTFWTANSDAWNQKWEDAVKTKSPARRKVSGGQGEWDLSGKGGWAYLTHHRRDR